MSGKKQETVYIMDIQNNIITTAAKIRSQFIKQPEEFRWDFCNSHEEYIYRMEQACKLVVLKPNKNIASNKIYTPKQYGRLLGIELNSNITVEEFDYIVADMYGLWNYPINEYRHIVENELRVVLIKFSNGSFRLAEVR